ncbi:hypothetical protein Leryth_018753 [Lithospermum erythrorhizon]|nr:hypothetical protein Leryth_018753 [Lithospermum erythrorhizon]
MVSLYGEAKGEVSEDFNGVKDEVKSVFNGTRRILRRAPYRGPCKATNPIDRCWRCDPNWAEDRQRLADCALGFGRDAIGGKGGRFYVVTDPSDDDVVDPRPGTLRWGVIQPEPLWIVFARSMVITLKQELIIQSFKTIDGRGFKVRISGGAGFTIQNVNNVIIHSLYIHDIISTNGGTIRDSTTHKGLRMRTDGDGIVVFGSSNIWLDHLSMSKAVDGLIDVVQGSTNVTISNCHFTDHNKVLLFGANDNYMPDKGMKVTVAYTHFGKRLVQRMPRCRLGFFNLVNNDYTHWEMYAIGGSSGAQILSEGNRFTAQNAHEETREVTHRASMNENWKSWTWSSVDDEFRRGAFFTTSGNQHPDLTQYNYGMIQHAPAHMVTEMTMFSGALGRCRVGRPC